MNKTKNLQSHSTSEADVTPMDTSNTVSSGMQLSYSCCLKSQVSLWKVVSSKASEADSCLSTVTLLGLALKDSLSELYCDSGRVPGGHKADKGSVPDTTGPQFSTCTQLSGPELTTAAALPFPPVYPHPRPTAAPQDNR